MPVAQGSSLGLARTHASEPCLGVPVRSYHVGATGYEDKSKIVLKAQGSGGLQELRETLDEDSVAYCLFRFMAGDQESKRVKFMCATA